MPKQFRQIAEMSKIKRMREREREKKKKFGNFLFVFERKEIEKLWCVAEN